MLKTPAYSRAAIRQSNEKFRAGGKWKLCFFLCGPKARRPFFFSFFFEETLFLCGRRPESRKLWFLRAEGNGGIFLFSVNYRLAIIDPIQW